MLPSIRSSTGAKIPSLGLGTWQMQSEVAYNAVRAALDAGYAHIDTAQMYDNEADVGRAVSDSSMGRGDVFITTKLKPGNLEPSMVESSVEASAKALGGHIDLLLIHWPDSSVALDRTLEAMRHQQDRGLVRAIGVSNFPHKLLARAAQLAPLACNQVEYHPYIAQTAMRDLCRRERVVLVAYCPLARGLVLRDPVVISIARRHRKTPSQIVLRWLMQQQGVAAVPKAANPAHIVENLAIDTFDLPMQDMANISSLARGQRLINPSFAPRW